MSDDSRSRTRSWAQKFGDAFRGLVMGVRGERSFLVHVPAAIAVVILGIVLRVTLIEWGLLVLSIALVLTAEMFNSALEWLARAIDQQHNPQLGGALDIGSAAVLLAALGAAAVGALVFVPRLVTLLSN